MDVEAPDIDPSSRGSPSGRGEETSLERGLRCLLAIIDLGSARVTTLAEQLGMPVSTVYRYLRSLRELGLVEERDGWHRPGERLVKSGRLVPNDTLAYLARPTLRSLALETRETALLTIRAGKSALCLAQVESSSPVRMAFEIGQVLPLHAGAACRVLLAWAPDDLVESVLAGPLSAYTASTPDAKTLRSELEATRATGFAISRGEFIPGAFAVAVPVFQGDSIVAGLALAGPVDRCTDQWQMSARQSLTKAGRTLSAQLS
jgi:DNA-binding IclR family transcriptional regulator